MQPVFVVEAANNQPEREYNTHHPPGDSNSEQFRVMLNEQEKKFGHMSEGQHDGQKHKDPDTEHDEEQTENQEYTRKMDKMNYYNKNAVEASFYMTAATKDYRC